MFMVNTLLVLHLLRIGSTSSAARKRDAIQVEAETSAVITHLMVPGREQGRCLWLRCLRKSRPFFPFQDSHSFHFTEIRRYSSSPGICASGVSSQRAKGKVKGWMLAMSVSPERPSQTSNR